MGKGVIVFGASGSGTTTLAKELALLLGFTHIDVDDYFWRWDTEVPYSVPRQREERIERLMNDIGNITGFVMSGSICGWDEAFIPFFRLAVFVTTPAEVRVQRLKAREFDEFGKRIQIGGDMYDNHQSFLEWASEYDTMEPPNRSFKLHEQWAAKLPCTVLRTSGMTPAEENAAQIAEKYKDIIR